MTGLNDAAKAFLPQGAGFGRWGSFSHLDVPVADDRTLLAMRCAAARTSEHANDIRVLAWRLGLRSSADMLDVVLAHDHRGAPGMHAVRPAGLAGGCLGLTSLFAERDPAVSSAAFRAA